MNKEIIIKSLIHTGFLLLSLVGGFIIGRHFKEVQKNPAPFTQEALETYTSEKMELLEIDNSGVAKMAKEIDEVKAIIKDARLDYCKRANGYTYKYPEVCLINDELKYIEIQTGGILETGQILSMPRQEAITYIRGRIYVEDVPFAADEIRAREEYEVFKSNSKKNLAQCPHVNAHILRTDTPEAQNITKIVEECESLLANKPVEKVEPKSASVEPKSKYWPTTIYFTLQFIKEYCEKDDVVKQFETCNQLLESNISI